MHSERFRQGQKYFMMAMAIIIAALFYSVPAYPEGAVWITKTGEAVLEGAITVDDVKSLAKKRARDSAVEEAVGSFIKGSTLVYNYQVAEDIITSIRRGVIVAEEIVQEGFKIPYPKQPPVYNVTMRVKVMPVQPERKEGFKVSVSLPRVVFKEGEDVEITITSTKSAYLYVFDIFSDDMVTLLVPSRYLADNRISAGTEFVFPGAGLESKGIKLKAHLLPGSRKAIERVKVIAVTERIEFFEKAIKEAVFKEFDGRSNTLIVNLFQALADLDPSSWAEATAVYEIRK